MPHKNEEDARRYRREYYRKNKDKIKANSQTPERKKARRKYLTQYNRDNKDKISETQARRYRDRASEYKEKVKQRLQEHYELVSVVKSNYGCMNDGCEWTGLYDPSILDFHHIDPDQKDVKISSMMCRSKKTIAEEINKCVVFCANCHRLFHMGMVGLPKDTCRVNDELLCE